MTHCNDKGSCKKEFEKSCCNDKGDHGHHHGHKHAHPEVCKPKEEAPKKSCCDGGKCCP